MLFERVTNNFFNKDYLMINIQQIQYTQMLKYYYKFTKSKLVNKKQLSMS